MPFARRCGGCTLQHAAIDDQLALKQRTLGEQLARTAELKPERWAEPLTGPAFGYRRRARLAVRWHTRDKRLEVGFRSGQPDIVAIDQCPVLVQPLQTLLPGLLEALHGLTKPQAIGHVELFSGTAEAVLIRHTAPIDGAPADSLPARIRHSSGCRARASRKPMCPGRRWATVLRPGTGVGGGRGFRPVNAPVNEAMVAQALSWLGASAGSGCWTCSAGWAISACRWGVRARRWWGGRCRGDGGAGAGQRAAQRPRTGALLSGGLVEAACRRTLGAQRVRCRAMIRPVTVRWKSSGR